MAANMIILLVEDEPLVAMMLEATLSDAGHQVLGPASTVSRALELAEQTPPEMALVNINLRDGGDGTDLAREMLHRWGTPSLFVSGQVMQARANKDVAVGYIGKPYSPQTVLDSVAVVKHMLDGDCVAKEEIPRGLELFDSE